jgi:hypothetical protein
MVFKYIQISIDFKRNIFRNLRIIAERIHIAECSHRCICHFNYGGVNVDGVYI